MFLWTTAADTPLHTSHQGAGKQATPAPSAAHPSSVEGQPAALARGPANHGRQAVVVWSLHQRHDEVLRQGCGCGAEGRCSAGRAVHTLTAPQAGIRPAVLQSARGNSATPHPHPPHTPPQLQKGCSTLSAVPGLVPGVRGQRDPAHLFGVIAGQPRVQLLLKPFRVKLQAPGREGRGGSREAAERWQQRALACNTKAERSRHRLFAPERKSAEAWACCGGRNQAQQACWDCFLGVSFSSSCTQDVFHCTCGWWYSTE